MKKQVQIEYFEQVECCKDDDDYYKPADEFCSLFEGKACCKKGTDESPRRMQQTVLPVNVLSAYEDDDGHHGQHDDVEAVEERAADPPADPRLRIIGEGEIDGKPPQVWKNKKRGIP